MKKLSTAFLAILITACGGGGGSNDPDREGSAYSTPAEPTLVGRWSYTYLATGCKEVYEFAPNGTFTYSALDERISGTYELQKLQSNQRRHELKLTLQTDNQEPDCNGFSDNDAGTQETRVIQLGTIKFDVFETQTSTIIVKTFNKSA